MSIQATGLSLRTSAPSRLSPLSGTLSAFLWVVSVALVDSLESPGLRGVVAIFATHPPYAAGLVLVGGAAACFWFAHLLRGRLGTLGSRLPCLAAAALLVAVSAFGFFSLRTTGSMALEALLAMVFFATSALLLATGLAGLENLATPRWLALSCWAFGVGAMTVWLATAASPILVLWCLCASIMLLPHGSPDRS